MPKDGTTPGTDAAVAVTSAGDGARAGALKEHLAEQSDLIVKDIGYYETLYRNAKWRSVALKAIAIMTFAVGVLTPLLDDLLGDPEGFDLLGLGFFCLTIAALALGLDRAMMISANRLNFNKALVELNFLARAFEIDRNRFEWLAICDGRPADLADSVFEAMRETEAARVEILRTESAAWSEEYRASITDLKERITSATQSTRTALSEHTTREEERLSVARPGFVTLRFRPKDKPDLEIALGDAERRVPAATNPVVFDGIPAGHCRLSIAWQANGVAHEIERVLDVGAGEVTEVEIDLQRP